MMVKMTERNKVRMQELWLEGWYQFASRVDSPNFDARPPQQTITLLVIHSISLPPGQYGGSEVEQFFTNNLDGSAHPYFEQLKGVRVSAHFFIRRDGRVMQFVSVDQRAWHAGVSSFQGAERCNDFSIGIELEGLEGEGFEALQYESLVSLSQALAEHYPLQAVASHRYIAPDRKNDPGEGFAWENFSRAVPALKPFI
jgi:N-acetyl-anhydromuramoyl-L-alanine amidase